MSELTAEAALIGCILRDPAVFDDARALGVTAESFENPVASAAWTAIASLAGGNVPVDLVSVAGRVPVGQAWLIDASVNSPVGANASYFAREVAEAHWSRKTALQIADITRDLLNRRPYDDNSNVRAQISSLERSATESGSGFMSRPTRNILADITAEIELAYLGKSKPGISTGIKSLDNMFGGWHAPDFTILAARPSVGKTTLGINFAGAAAAQGFRTAFFTIEMLDTQIIAKEISRRSGIFSSKFRTGRLHPDECDRVADAIEQIAKEDRMIVNGRAGRTIDTFEAEVRRLHRKGLDVAFIDYVGLMRAAGRWDSRARELGEISGRIKSLCIDLQMPIVGLAQVNRESERGTDRGRIPNLSHLKDSGSLEQDADNVLFIHRDEDMRYWLAFAKNRHGPVGIIEVEANLAANKFYDKGGHAIG